MDINEWLSYQKTKRVKRASKSEPFLFLENVIVLAIEQEEQNQKSANIKQRETILCKGIMNNNFF